jgi:two-component system LytT family response regulator
MHESELIAMSFTTPVSFPPITEDQTVRSIEVFTFFEELDRRSPTRFAIKANEKICFVNPAEVVAVLAGDNYVLLQQESDSCLLRESISVIAEKFEPFGFIRIHRSVLVNAPFVEEIKAYSSGEYGLVVKGGREYAVTRNYRQNLKALAEFWIGSETFSAGQER